MTITPIKTKAEQQLAAHFEVAAPQLPGGTWVPAARRAAFARFVAQGLPHRRLEGWKYTDLRASLKDAFPPAAPSGEQNDEAALALALGPKLAATLNSAKSLRMLFINGVFVGDASNAWPAEYIEDGVLTLAERLVADKVGGLERAFTEPSSEDANPVLDLNSAFATDGACFKIAPNTHISRPIDIVFYSTSATPNATSLRNVIEVGAGAEVTIVESYVAKTSAPHQTNSVTQLRVGKGAKVEHIKLLAEGTQATHFSSWIVDVEAGATYRATQISESPALARNDVNVTFAGEGATFTFSAAMLGRGKSHIDTTMVIDHAVPRCTSRELIKAVLDDEARGIFQGKVIVRPDAQKSDGKQSARALLLSPDAEFDSKPELEIYADDVVCGHGSTAAELDEDQVFYLMARGIPRAQARAMLVEAFAAEAIESIEHEGIREAMRARLQTWLSEAKS